MNHVCSQTRNSVFNPSVLRRVQRYNLRQCGQSGGPRTASGPGQLVNRNAKLFVNLLLVTTNSFTLFVPKDLEINRGSYLACCFTYKYHMSYLLT
jgi:hypothetical protein